MQRKRIVLYQPQSCRTRPGPPYLRYTQDLPLALLAIGAWPLADGYEVVLIDGSRYASAEAHRRVVEACDGAMLYATTGILGWQVADAFFCTRAVKARYPRLPAVIGGWFASGSPELELATGLYDAVAIGQGELTFRDLVAAIDCGAALESVPGLLLPREGSVVPSAARAVVGWDKLQARGLPGAAAARGEPPRRGRRPGTGTAALRDHVLLQLRVPGAVHVLLLARVQRAALEGHARGAHGRGPRRVAGALGLRRRAVLGRELRRLRGARASLRRRRAGARPLDQVVGAAAGRLPAALG
jgi:hypothetical protein